MSDAFLSCWGRLGQDPKAITTKSGKPMATASLAVSLGEESTIWLGLVAFGGQADILLKHSRADCLSVSGRLQQRRWTDKEGKVREDLQVVVDTIVSARTVRPGGGKRRESVAPAEAAGATGVEFDDALDF